MTGDREFDCKGRADIEWPLGGKEQCHEFGDDCDYQAHGNCTKQCYVRYIDGEATEVFLDGNPEEASCFSGQWHTVCTGVTFIVVGILTFLWAMLCCAYKMYKGIQCDPQEIGLTLKVKPLPLVYMYSIKITWVIVYMNVC